MTEFQSPGEFGNVDALLVEEESRAEPRSRVVLTLNPREGLRHNELEEIGDDPLLGRLVGNHLFILDDAGVMSLLGIESIPLLGLTEAEIVSRLSAESYLSVFDISAQILGSGAHWNRGVEALRLRCI